jgi:hypothetical protein
MRSNGVFHYLACLSAYPEVTRLWRFLERFARLGRITFLLLDGCRHSAVLRQMGIPIFDLDCIVLTVYGLQERAKVGYNPKVTILAT